MRIWGMNHDWLMYTRHWMDLNLNNLEVSSWSEVNLNGLNDRYSSRLGKTHWHAAQAIRRRHLIGSLIQVEGIGKKCWIDSEFQVASDLEVRVYWLKELSIDRSRPGDDSESRMGLGWRFDWKIIVRSTQMGWSLIGSLLLDQLENNSDSERRFALPVVVKSIIDRTLCLSSKF